jgi:hypothetical protein
MRRFLLVLVILLMLILFVKGLEYNIPVSVTVLPIYELSIDIDILNNKLSSGENLSVFIELEKTDLTNMAGEISVDLNYEIIKKKRKKFEIIARGYAGSLIVDDESNQTIQIPTPSDAHSGKYILKIIASNPQSYSDEDSETFVVRKRYKPSFSRIFFSFFKNPNLKN